MLYEMLIPTQKLSKSLHDLKRRQDNPKRHFPFQQEQNIEVVGTCQFPTAESVQVEKAI